MSGGKGVSPLGGLKILKTLSANGLIFCHCSDIFDAMFSVNYIAGETVIQQGEFYFTVHYFTLRFIL